MSDELKPCPFCGTDQGMLVSSMTGKRVICRNCGCGSGVAFNGSKNQDAEAISNWNTRADHASRPASPDVRVVVKPLEWFACLDGTFHDTERQYEIVADKPHFKLLRGVTGGTSYVGHYGSIDGAKSGAQADYERRILSAIIGGQS